MENDIDGQILASAEVVDSEGERLGSVIAAAPTYIVVESGFFFPTDYYIPRSSIAAVTDGVVQLAVTKAESVERGWEVNPAANTDEPDLAAGAA